MTSSEKFFSGREFSRGVSRVKINCSYLLKGGGVFCAYRRKEKNIKKIKKIFKNLLTMVFACDIIVSSNRECSPVQKNKRGKTHYEN